MVTFLGIAEGIVDLPDGVLVGGAAEDDAGLNSVAAFRGTLAPLGGVPHHLARWTLWTIAS